MLSFDITQKADTEHPALVLVNKLGPGSLAALAAAHYTPRLARGVIRAGIPLRQLTRRQNLLRRVRHTIALRGRKRIPNHFDDRVANANDRHGLAPQEFRGETTSRRAAAGNWVAGYYRTQGGKRVWVPGFYR